MTTVAKQVYYRNRGMPASLRTLYRREEGARRILDLGCGTGELGRGRQAQDEEVFGVDIDIGALRQAMRFEKVTCVDLESSPLPYRDASFDAVLAKDIFEHLHDPGRLAREVARVARPGAVVITSVVMAKPRTVWADYTHVRGFTRRTASQLLEDAGLKVERIWRMGGVPLSGRLGFVRLVPTLLRLPGCSQLWASSWQLKARKPRGSDAGEASGWHQE